MLANVTCFWCKVKEDKTSMIQETNKKYYHKKGCHQAYIKDKTFKAKERQEKDDLTDTIVRIMGYSGRQSMPSSFFSSYLEPYRNDDVMYGKLEKKYKKGFSYKTIEDTFLYCEANIRKYVGLKREKNSFKDILGELRYAWKIVRENVENMLKEEIKTDKQNANTHKLVENIAVLNDVSERIKSAQKQIQNKNEDKVDLSSLFD